MARKTGKEFESAFAAHMVGKMAVTHTTLRVLAKGKVAVRPWECDIHGVSYSSVWKFIQYGSFLVFFVGLAVVFRPDLFGAASKSLNGVGKEVEAVINSSTGYSVEGFGVMILAAVLAVAGFVGQGKTTRHVWVECKDRKTPIKRTDIIKVVHAVEDVRANEQAVWKAHDIWFAATCDFDVDATNFADEKKVRCFRATMPKSSEDGLEVTEV